MPALSRAEGVARPSLSFHSASSSNEPRANSNYSRTCAASRGRGIYQSLGQTNCSLRLLFAGSPAVSYSLSPFPTSLTQKQGGRGYWPSLRGAEGSRQLSSMPDALLPLRFARCALCVSAVSHLFFPFVPLVVSPCPTTYFPLQWEIPFPVITGENQ